MADERLRLFADYTLDAAQGCLLHGGELVHLRPQSYEVLKYLAENRGRLIGKDKLIQQVWQGRAVGDDSLVQCLRDVRQALGADGAGYIRNVRGRGYIFDAAPEGIETTPIATVQTDVVRPLLDGNQEEAAADEHGRREVVVNPTRREGSISLSARALLLATVVLAIAGMAYGLMADRVPAPTGIESIAVLPFVNDTGNSDADYLADGSTESLINSLSQLPALSVKARSTVFRYQGKDMTPQRIAQELSVQAIVYGRLVRRGDRLTVFLSLVDGRNGNQLWGDDYTQTLAALPSLQREIAGAVARRLQTRLSGVDEGKLTKGYTAHGDAYLLYLRGRYHFFKTTQPEIRTAIRLYQQAIDDDPTYALAHAGLADAYRTLSIVGHVPSKEAFPQARAAAIRALELDKHLAEAHIALGWVGFSFDWDWIAAEHELQEAIALSPGNADAHRAYAHLLSNQARHDEALVEGRRARELDSRSLLTNALEGQFLFYAGRYDEAETRLRKTLEIDPDYWVAHVGLGRVYLLRGMLPEAIAAFRNARELSFGSTESITQLGYALAKSGNRGEARATLKELELLTADQYVPAYSFAMILNGLGERDAALRQLERSVDEREVQATFIKIDTRWDGLRPDPRFVTLLKRVNLK